MGKQCELDVEQVLWVPNYTRNLLLVKKRAQQRSEVTFEKDAHIKTFDGTLPPLMLTSDGLNTQRVSPSLCIVSKRAPSVDPLSGIARMGESYTGG